MANQSTEDAYPPSNLQKYGFPLYGAAWVPYEQVRSKLKSSKDEDENRSDDDKSSSPSSELNSSQNYVVLAGGGGEGSSGIPNAIALSHVDYASNSLSDQPVAKLVIGSDLPYRMAIHSGGDGIICALPNSCRFFEWEEPESSELHKLSAKASEKVLSKLEDAGQQLALAFNHEGSVFAAGGENGTLRIFKWPSMEIILEETEAHSSVKDLTFSSDGKFLVSLGGPLCRVWDVASAKAIASLPKEKDERFAYCRFSPINDKNEVLYVVAMTDQYATMIAWNTTTWKRMHSKRIIRGAISAFNVSSDGKLFAIGTIEGDVSIVNPISMRVHTVVKKAHLGFITALAFSNDSRALLSASMDSSVRVTLIHEKKDSGGIMNLWVIIFVMLLAIAVYFMKDKGIIP